MTSLVQTETLDAHINKKQKTIETAHHNWQDTISHSINSVVSIRFSQVSSFDTEQAENSEATGFIVDEKLGLVLTNRHVVCSGPFVGECILHDHEETDVYPVYRDPIHDFGFLRFDPKTIKYMKLKQIDLAPELAQVGLDIRVVGNDAGEKLSILAGSISRLNRNAPDYGELTYNDFNTFYLQAASSTSGGSSGSPVLNIQGKAVALQAGGHTKAATDFFFPLDRVKRALDCIRNGMDVTRGTIQVQFVHRPFDEVRRLGLQEKTEKSVRDQFPLEIGMLVAETVVPNGPASDFLEEGDVLISVNDEIITHFVRLEDILDSNINETIRISVERGGALLQFHISVQNLHSITPDRYVSAGGAKLNALSYQLARQFAVPVSGVYLTEPGGMFYLDQGQNGWIISSLNAIPTPDLGSFIKVFKELSNGMHVPVTYYSIADIHTMHCEIIHVDRHWSDFSLAIRNDRSGVWDFQELGTSPPEIPQLPLTATFSKATSFLGKAQTVLHSLVKINMCIPFKIEGFPKSRKQGAGLIVDSEKGLVVCSRFLAPSTICTITLTIAGSITIPAKVIFLHPTHNFAILSYEPSLVGKTAIKSASISKIPLSQGKKVMFFAYGRSQLPICLETTVTAINMFHIPQNVTPRFRAINFNAISIDTPLSQTSLSGVLSDSQGKIQGLWLSFNGETTHNGNDRAYHFGLQIDVVMPIVERLSAGVVPVLRGLPIELMPLDISKSRQMGVGDNWVKKIEKLDAETRQMFMIKHSECDLPCSKVLKDLDIILSIDGNTVSKLTDFELSEDWNDEINVTLIREKKEISLKVPTVVLDGECTKKIVIWAGAILHEPHRAVRQQSKSLPSNIYVSGRSKGSPSYTYGLMPTVFITHVNGIETNDLDKFVEIVSSLKDGYVRIKTVSFDMVPSVVSLKTNRYFKTRVLLRNEQEKCGWKI